MLFGAREWGKNVPIPDVRCTHKEKGQAGTSTHREQGWTLPRPAQLWYGWCCFRSCPSFAFFPIKQVCDALHHLTLNLDVRKDKIRAWLMQTCREGTLRSSGSVSVSVEVNKKMKVHMRMCLCWIKTLLIRKYTDTDVFFFSFTNNCII